MNPLHGSRNNESWFHRGESSMKRITRGVLLALLLTVAVGAMTYAATYTAATCNQSDVNAVINGPTHTAVDGDVINIPSGSCTWTSGITVPRSIGITIAGAGTPNSTASTTGASSSCTQTDITLTGATMFSMTPNYGNSTSRLSCMEITYGSGSSIGALVQGTCTASGCPNLRVDNITYANWAGHASNGISYGINAVGDMFGVFDHDTISGTPGNYLQLVEVSHASYLGVGQYGDNSWAQSENYGSANFLYFENNAFSSAACCENEGNTGSYTNQGGGRVVMRFNTVSASDGLTAAMYWHGTESNGRPRGGRAFEFYGNIFTCTIGTWCNQVVAPRSGTGLVWGNTNNFQTGAGMSSFFTLTTYRTLQSIGNWGACDGTSVWDANDGTTYYSGTILSVSGSNPYTITVTGSPGWSANQWLNSSSPYSLHDVTISDGSEIRGSGTNTLTVIPWTSSSYTAGDTIQILRATSCIDQAGGRGAGILYSGSTPSPSSTSREVLSPTYVWSNAFSGGTPLTVVSPDTARVIRNREYYVENLNQAAQTNATTPFDGTTTVGMGHGTLSNRPTTCTTGVAYWATDQGSWNQGGSGGQGELFVCTATNTWTLTYTPYTYPHPLISGSAPGQVLSPPTNLQVK